MVIRARARIFGGGQAPPTFRVPAGSVVDQLDLIELQLDRRFAPEHGDDDADLVLFDIDLINSSDEGGQRAVVDADASEYETTISCFSMPSCCTSSSVRGVGFVPEPTKPVTPRTFLTMYHASSDMIILMRT